MLEVDLMTAFAGTRSFSKVQDPNKRIAVFSFERETKSTHKIDSYQTRHTRLEISNTKKPLPKGKLVFIS